MATETERKTRALATLFDCLGRKISDLAMSGWLASLDDVPAKMVEAGVVSWLKTQTNSFPNPALFRQYLQLKRGKKPQPSPEKALETRAEAEWGIVLKAMVDVGSYGSPKFCPQTEKTIEIMGGWPHLCATLTQSNMDFKRRDFVKLWQDAEDISEAMELGAGAETKAIESAPGAAAVPDVIPSHVLKRIDSLEDDRKWQLQ